MAASATTTCKWEESSNVNAVYALEVQAPWGDWMLQGRKTIETRRYPLPPVLLHRRMYLLQTPAGQANTSSLPDQVDLRRNNHKIDIIGTVVFDRCVQYPTRLAFIADEAAHCVAPHSPYAWPPAAAAAPLDEENHTAAQEAFVVYGWHVAERAKGGVVTTFAAAQRCQRSIFQLALE